MAAALAGRPKQSWHERFFDSVLYDQETVLTVDPAKRKIARKDHPLLPVVSLVGPAEDDAVPPKGLILAPFHVPDLLAHPDRGAAALARVEELAKEVRAGLESAYGASSSAHLRHLIWAGMGGSIEDKYAGLAAGLLSSSDSAGEAVRLWGLDDVNGDTLGHIFEGISAGEAGGDADARLAAGLRKTVVVAQALGMTSVEPVFNVKRALLPTFGRFGLDAAAHFYKVTIPGSLLDQALQPPVRNIEHQPFGQSTCAGRHDYVSHGMLLPLRLCGGSLPKYVAALQLKDDEVELVLSLAQWIFDQGAASQKAGGPARDKLVLLAPMEWRGRWHEDGEEWREAILWLKQHLEESLGKEPGRLLKLVTTLQTPSCPEDQLVLALRVKGLTNVSDDELSALRGQGFEVRALDLLDSAAVEGGAAYALPRVFQMFSVLKYRLAELWAVCAVNQPPVEYYKRVVAYLEQESGEGVRSVEALLAEEPAHVLAQPLPEGRVTINYHASALNGSLPASEVAAEVAALGLDAASAADVLGCLHRVALRRTRPHRLYGEYIYFGNLTRGAEAREMRTLLASEGAGALWEKTARSFADVGKGPGVGHATHAMSKQGRVLTLSIAPAEHASPNKHTADYPTGYQTNNTYANVLALAGYDAVSDAGAGTMRLVSEQGHPGMVVLVQLPRNDAASRAALAALLRRAAEVLRMEPAVV